MTAEVVATCNGKWPKIN